MIKKDIFLQAITDEVTSLDIAGYLRDEVVDLFKNLHYYKLKNIHQNLDALKEYLNFLDHNSTQQIHALELKQSSLPKTDHDVFYYVSKRGLVLIGEDVLRQKIWANHFNLSYVMQAVKGFLLLTADEFCNASQTRMSINRMFRENKIPASKR